MAELYIPDLLTHIARSDPQRVAVAMAEGDLSFAELMARAERFADQLQSYGIGQGDIIGIYGKNSHEWLICLVGLMIADAVPVGLNARFRAEELKEVAYEIKIKRIVDIDDCDKNEMRFIPTESLTDAKKVEPEPGHQRIAKMVILTGGTTGSPKGVVWRHEAFIYAVFRGTTEFGRLEDDVNFKCIMQGSKNFELPKRILIPMPLGHGAGLHWSLSTLITGHTVVYPHGGNFEPNRIWQQVENANCSVLTIAGDAMAIPLIDAVPRHAKNLSSRLQTIRSSGARLSAKNIRSLMEFMPQLKIIVDMGASETGTLASRTFTKDLPAVEPICFYPISDLKLVGQDGNWIEKTSQAEGRIARSTRIADGYLNASSSDIFFRRDGLGWAMSSDLAQYQSNGTIAIIGRAKRFINSGGEKLSPDQIESVVCNLPMVSDCLVIGKADSRWGEMAVLIVKPGDHFDLQTLVYMLGKRLPRFMIPREYFVVESIPRLFNGKLDLRQAQQLVESTTGVSIASLEVGGAKGVA